MCSSDLLKRLATGEIVMPMYEPTPEQKKRNEEYYQNLKNEKKRLKAQSRIDRDRTLAAIGIDHDEDQHLIEKVIEVQSLARKLEEEAEKGAQKVLKETLGTSVADTSDAVPQVAVSEAAGPPPVIRTSVSLPDTSVTGITSEAAASEAVASDVPKTSKEIGRASCRERV